MTHPQARRESCFLSITATSVFASRWAPSAIYIGYELNASFITARRIYSGINDTTRECLEVGNDGSLEKMWIRGSIHELRESFYECGAGKNALKARAKGGKTRSRAEVHDLAVALIETFEAFERSALGSSV